jgi:hypothetical protein
MMKSMAKLVLVAAVAGMAISVAATPSFAAKKKAASKACTPLTWCATQCSGNSCKSGVWCGASGKAYPTLTGCVDPFCTPKC